jgi:hypothetical protein
VARTVSGPFGDWRTPRKILRPLDAASRFTPAGFPEANITGASNFLPGTSAKLLELLKSVAPNALRVIVLRDPDNAGKWRPEQSDQGAPDQPAKIAHRERVSADSRSRSAVLGLR